MENLIKKVVEDAEKKAADIVSDAEKELEEKYAAASKEVEADYERRLTSEKMQADMDSQREIAAFRLEKEKELLAVRNRLMEEAIRLTGEKFTEYIARHADNIADSIRKEMAEEPPEIEVTGKALSVRGSNWTAVVTWEKVRASIEEELKEKIGRYFLQDENAED